MKQSTTVSPEDPFSQQVTDEYYCPVCGIGLARSDFDTPEREYFCPFCGTRQTPSILSSG